jgi:hypothetical protein
VSTLFDRLAERAADSGGAGLLKPRIRSRFEPTGPVDAPGIVVVEEEVPARPGRRAMPRSVETAAPSGRTTPPPAAPGERAQTGPRNVPPAPGLVDADDVAVGPASDAHREARSSFVSPPPREPAPQAPANPNTAEPAFRVEPAAETARDDGPSRPVPMPPPIENRPPRAAKPAGGDEPAAVRLPTQEPAAPRVREAPPNDAVRQPQPPPLATRREAGEDAQPSITVRIGRVEVRAGEAPAARSPPAPPRAPPSRSTPLTQYLGWKRR